MVIIEPELNVADEHFSYPENLVKQLGLAVEMSANGITINGEYSFGKSIRAISRDVYLMY